MRRDVTRANAVSERKKSFIKFDFIFAELTNVKRKSVRRQNKKYQRLNKKLDLKQTMSELGKPFLKKSDQKKEYRKSMSK